VYAPAPSFAATRLIFAIVYEYVITHFGEFEFLEAVPRYVLVFNDVSRPDRGPSAHPP
jgi:hypothetical protein